MLFLMVRKFIFCLLGHSSSRINGLHETYIELLQYMSHGENSFKGECATGLYRILIKGPLSCKNALGGAVARPCGFVLRVCLDPLT